MSPPAWANEAAATEERSNSSGGRCRHRTSTAGTFLAFITCVNIHGTCGSAAQKAPSVCLGRRGVRYSWAAFIDLSSWLALARPRRPENDRSSVESTPCRNDGTSFQRLSRKSKRRVRGKLHFPGVNGGLFHSPNPERTRASEICLSPFHRETVVDPCFAPLLGFLQERDLRERPMTCRTEYIRACAELSLSPIPVFDSLLIPGNGPDSGAMFPAEGQGGELQSFDAASPPVFELDLRRCEYVHVLSHGVLWLGTKLTRAINVGHVPSPNYKNEVFMPDFPA